VLTVMGGGCGGSTATQATAHDPDGGGDAAIADAAPMSDSPAPPRDTGAPFDAGPDVVVPSLPSVLLFGGDELGIANDTWEWRAGMWARRAPMATPTKRAQHALAGLDGKVVLFGGRDNANDFDDTWEWDGAAWTQRMVKGPPARWGHAMATLGSKVVLYGGGALGAQDLDDTWEWDGTTWTQKQVTGPGKRIGQGMTTLNGKVVLFGGIGNYADTWEYDGSTWTKAAAATPSAPAERAFMGFATLGATAILFGGEHDANHMLNDTWAWDGAKWTQLSPATSPAQRFRHAMTEFDGKLVVFGGAPQPGTMPILLSDTWTWDGTTWTESTGGEIPYARYADTIAARRPATH
jgi:hypothetical protein